MNKKDFGILYFSIWAIAEIILGVYLSSRPDGFYPGLFSIVVGIIIFNYVLWIKDLIIGKVKGVGKNG